MSNDFELAPNESRSTDSAPVPEAEELAAMQIQLLERAMDIIKAHASEAATNLIRLKALLASELETESTQYSALQRERWLEERRELDATRALWSACQHVEAVVDQDLPFFVEQRNAQQRRRLWYEKLAEEERLENGPSLPSDESNQGGFYPLSKSFRRTKPRPPTDSPQTSEGRSFLPIPPAVPHSRTRLLPLMLASKADPAALARKTNRVSSTSTSSSSASSELRTPVTFVHNIDPIQPPELDGNGPSASGTVTIYRSSAFDSRPPSSVIGHEGRETPTEVSEIKKLVEDKLSPVPMPDYVADLLSEFDTQSTVPALPLFSPKGDDGSVSSHSHRGSVSFASPKSAPTSPARSRRTLHKVPSKRFSGFFAKRQPSSSSLNQSPYIIHSTQIPSRLGSSIDLVIPEDRPFSLDFNLDLSDPETSRNTSSGSRYLNPKRFSDSAASMASLLSSREFHSDGGDPNATPVPPSSIPSSAPATSQTVPDDILSPPTSATSAVTTSGATPTEDKKFASKLRKRISLLRF
ncbi:hypothetical protein CC2G_007116 [Coprinopsis cinerea AmutBmut pab1-1]|nr:hypothetical protein CC2G_007116 [Coprinopsis cinerea AmutBmut pab1-1]